MTELPGYFERLSVWVTEADRDRKSGSDGRLIRLRDARTFSAAHKGAHSRLLI
ncbi:hypothetical protein [Pseudomonas sp. NPDC089534]|uniref:hypothetical protein n=1 Tax=Pseudomonas sp. NPDC089534 TaxID=3364468 RepID=UPI00381241D9